jgi:hypothetical protein
MTPNPNPNPEVQKYGKLFAGRKERERVSPEVEVVLVAELHLDSPRVLSKLRELLSELELAPPHTLLLLGNFVSPQGRASEALQRFRNGMEALGSLLRSFGALRETHVILVPGPQDPVQGLSLRPHPPLPEALCTPVQGLAVLAPNPVRLRLGSDHEVVVHREDLVHRLLRHSIVPLDSSIPVSQVRPNP